MSTEEGYHCACWKVDARPEEVEGLLAQMRAESPEMILQVFSVKRAPNPTAVEIIAAQTLKALRSGSTLAKRPEMDVLLRLAGTRQIGAALDRMGYKSNRGGRLFLVAASEGDEASLFKMKRMVGDDGRFQELQRKPPSKADLELVERAALLATRV